MHMILLTEGPSQLHQDFVNWVGNREYPIEGKLRKGVNSPVISEIKLFDVRVKEQVSQRFLEDLDRHIGLLRARKSGSNIEQHLGPYLGLMGRVFDTFTPLKRALIPKPPTKREHVLPGWYYVNVLGTLTDPKGPEGHELL